MNRNLRMIILWALVGLVSGCTTSDTADEPSETAVSRSVTGMLEALASAMKSNDVDTVLAYYAEDYTGPQGVTKPFLIGYFGNLAASGTLAAQIMDIDALSVVVEDDGVVASPVMFVSDTGRISYAYRLRRTDDSWEILNTTLVPNPTDPARENRVRARFQSVSLGVIHGCGLRADDGGLACWGGDTARQLSDARTDVNYERVNGGGLHSCGIRKSSGELDCWGADTYMDTQVRGKVSDTPEGVAFAEIDGGAEHTCAIRRDDRTVYCWGDDSAQRVSGVPKGLAFSSLDVGGSHTCGVTSKDSRVVCWGWDESGQVSGVPENAEYSQVAAGWFHSCALRADSGAVECWGEDSGGQISGAPGDVSFTSIAAKYNTCGLRRSNGHVICWGPDYDVFGNYIGVVTNAPKDIAFDAISVGGSFACGIRRDNRQLVCWGSDVFGQVSDAP
ncbi:MAG: hypothetical protein AAF525_08830 [Pseudomonadota bacterium]